MKKIISFFKFIFSVFDKYVIMTLTRVVFKISKALSKPNRYFETWLSKSTTLLFLSLFLSIAIFIMVDRKIITFSSQSAEVLKEQSINVKYNEEQYVVEELPNFVDVTLIGSKADLYIAKQSSSNGVTVDLTGLTPGTHKVNIEYEQGLSGIEYSVNPSIATIIIYKKASDARELTYDLVNSEKLDNKLIVSDVKLNVDEVTIRGAEYKIGQVTTVKALIDLEQLPEKEPGKHVINNIDLKAYDVKGNVVDVEFVPSKLSAEIDLSSPSKKVSLNFVSVGDLPTGKAISGYSFNQNEVIIYGDSAYLENINSIDVPVDVSNIKENSSFKVEIKKPVGVKTISTNYVTIDLEITDASTEPVKFEIPLTGINVGEGLIAQPIDDENGFITVEVKGASSVLSTIDKSDISVYVDLEGLSEGTYTREIIVKGTNPLVTYKAKRTEATIVLSIK